MSADDSTENRDVALLCIWVRRELSPERTFEITEDLLALKSLHERTRGEDIQRALSEACKHKGLVVEMRKISPDFGISQYCAPASIMQQVKCE